MTRLEYKYLVDLRFLDEMRKRLLPYIYTDSHASGNGVKKYCVKSIYFDTSNLKYYHEKIDGIRHRKKLRIRGYDHLNEMSGVFLEIKNKTENFVHKNRSQILFKDLFNIFHQRNWDDAILIDDKRGQGASDMRRFFYYLINDALAPVVFIKYDREAYYSTFDRMLRITIDKNIRSKKLPQLNDLIGEESMKFMLKDKFVLEIKFTRGYPRWLQSIIRDYNLLRVPVSKYTRSVEDHNLNRTNSKFDVLGHLNLLHPNLQIYQKEDANYVR